MFVPHRKHTCGPPRPVTGFASPFICRRCSYVTGSMPMGLHGQLQGYLNISMGLHGLLRGQLNFLHVNDIRTSQETYLWTSTTCYAVRFTLYMQRIFVPGRKYAYGPPRPVTGLSLFFVDVRTSQETYLWVFTASYWYTFIFYICRWYSFLTTNTCGPLRSLTGIVLPFILKRCSYLPGNSYRPPHPLTGRAFLADDVCTSQETHLCASKPSYGDSLFCRSFKPIRDRYMSTWTLFQKHRIPWDAGPMFTSKSINVSLFCVNRNVSDGKAGLTISISEGNISVLFSAVAFV
jgi:hypothetical protein